MNVYQFSVSYEPEQDRLLMRVNSREGEETSLMLTRRLMARLWPALNRLHADTLLQQEPAPVVAASPAPLRQMLVDFRRDALLQGADFATPYQPAPARSSEPGGLPDTAGPPPLLVTHVEVKPEPGHRQCWHFAERGTASPERPGLHMSLDAQAVQGVLHLLEQALHASEWLQPFQGVTAAGPISSSAADDAVHEEEGVPTPWLN